MRVFENEMGGETVIVAHPKYIERIDGVHIVISEPRMRVALHITWKEATELVGELSAVIARGHR